MKINQIKIKLKSLFILCQYKNDFEVGQNINLRFLNNNKIMFVNCLVPCVNVQVQELFHQCISVLRPR